MTGQRLAILSTRSLLGDLLKRAATAGLDIEVIPFIEIRHKKEAELKARLERFSTQSLCAIFTSSHAVESVMDMLPAAPKGWTIACLEGATKDVVREHWKEEAIVATASDAAGLAQKLEGNEATLVFFCGDLRRNELPDALNKAGRAWEQLVVYETIAKPQQLDKSYAAVLFFSPSAVQSFFTRNAVPASVLLFTIGRTTAGSIGKDIPNKIIVSPQPLAATLIDTLITYFRHEERPAAESPERGTR